MPPEVFTRTPLQEGPQPDGSIRVNIGVNFGSSPEISSRIEGVHIAVDITFDGRHRVARFVNSLARYVHLGLEELATQKDELVEAVATSLVNKAESTILEDDREIVLRLKPGEFRAYDSGLVEFASQVALNQTFIKLLPQASLGKTARDIKPDFDEIFTVLSRLDLLGEVDLKRIRREVVLQGKSIYPEEVLEILDNVEEKARHLAEESTAVINPT